jgi:hypothetical protein
MLLLPQLKWSWLPDARVLLSRLFHKRTRLYCSLINESSVFLFEFASWNDITSCQVIRVTYVTSNQWPAALSMHSVQWRVSPTRSTFASWVSAVLEWPPTVPYLLTCGFGSSLWFLAHFIGNLLYLCLTHETRIGWVVVPMGVTTLSRSLWPQALVNCPQTPASLHGCRYRLWPPTGSFQRGPCLLVTAFNHPPQKRGFLSLYSPFSLSLSHSMVLTPFCASTNTKTS